MNIAIDIRNIGRGRTGSEVVIRELTRALLALDRSNTYFLMTDTDDPLIRDAIKHTLGLAQYTNVQIYSLPTRTRGAWILWTVWRFLRRHQIDIFHTEYIVPFFISQRTKVMTHIHDVSFVALRKKISRKDLFFLDLLIPRSLRRADAILAVSHFTQHEIYKYYPHITTKVHLIENAPPQRFLSKVSRDDRERVHQKYHLPQDYIFTLGSMQPRKNIPFLIDAFARLASRIPEAQLVLTGHRGRHYDDAIDLTYQKDSQIKDRIIFTGFVADEDLPALYAGARLFVYPSLYEGFSLPILEAFTQDTIVALSDLAVHREVAGHGAVYFPPDAVDQCTQVLYDAYTNQSLRKTLQTQKTPRLAAYSWERSAQKFLHIIDTL